MSPMQCIATTLELNQSSSCLSTASGLALVSFVGSVTPLVGSTQYIVLSSDTKTKERALFGTRYRTKTYTSTMSAGRNGSR